MFQMDDTSKCPYEIAYQHKHIHRYVCSLVKMTDRARFSEIMNWYKKVLNSKTMYNPKKKKKKLSKAKIKTFLVQSVLFADEVLGPASCALFHQLLSIIKKCSHEISNSTAYAFLAFTPIQSGSIREKTKTYVPNESDLTCVVKDTKGLEILEGNKSQSMIRVNADANRGWVSLCLGNNILCPKLLSSIFTTIMKDIIAKITAMYLKPFSFSIHSVQMKDKICCFHFLFRNDIIKDLVISVDFVLAIPHPEYKPEYELPPLTPEAEQEECKFYLIPKVSQKKDITAQNAFFLVSYSDREARFVTSLPISIKNGFIYAKAARNAKLCSLPAVISAKVLEPLSVEDYVTTYMLKTCLMFSMSDDRISKIFFDATSYECAYALYVMLQCFVKEKGKLPFYFDRKINLVNCEHDFDSDYDNKLGCCLKRALIEGFCQGIMQSFEKLIPEHTTLRSNVRELLLRSRKF